VLQVRSDRSDIRPYGLYGGWPGRPSSNTLNPDTENTELLPSKFNITITDGDVFSHTLAGGGGYGNPLERDPQAVLSDVRNEYVSAASAADDYGVVVDTANWTIDQAATIALRATQAIGNASMGEINWVEPGEEIEPGMPPTSAPASATIEEQP